MRFVLLYKFGTIFLLNVQARGECSSRANQLFNAPEKCVAKETMTNQQICGKIQWYCDDPTAQVLVRNIKEMKNLDFLFFSK